MTVMSYIVVRVSNRSLYMSRGSQSLRAEVLSVILTERSVS